MHRTRALVGLCTITIGLAASSSATAVATPAANATTPVVTLKPASSFYNQQVIEVSVGANSLFIPNTSIKILECAVGATSDAQCDGNTQNADSVIVGADGSFDYKSYTMYTLPNPLLGEPPTNSPKCDSVNRCMLYVGEDQNDFTQPMLFSSVFAITPGPRPKVTRVTPASGPVGTTVTVAGSNFSGATKVLFGTKRATTFTCAASTSCAAVAPSGVTGTVAIEVVTANGKSLANPKATFTYR